MRACGSALVPMLSGALAAAAAGLLLGAWPGLPPVSGPAPTVAAYALVAAPLLLIGAAARAASVAATTAARPTRRAAPSPRDHTHAAWPAVDGWRPAVPELAVSTMLDDPYGPSRSTSLGSRDRSTPIRPRPIDLPPLRQRVAPRP